MVTAWSNSTCLSILVLSEDSAQTAHETIERIARKAARILDSSCRTDRIAFEPASPGAKIALRGNIWKSTLPRDRPNRVALVQSITTKVAESDGYVLFHIDGDRTWDARDTSENVAKFDALIRQPVREFLRTRLTDDQVEKAITRLRLWVPFYSIEAWLYQNTAAAIELCRTHHRNEDEGLFVSWGADRSQLDEVVKVKETSCLGSRYNLELASKAFPAAEVYNTGKSFTAAVDQFIDCDGFLDALARTSI